ncbi:MAG: hypothetical protein IPK68_19505 [Bdellovibrionales bacterium]|nr:hypothetical protein [Bdellovibrionales bacterium]
MSHVYALIEKSARLDLNLDDVREAAKDCKCDSCQMELYRSIPDLAKHIGCPAPAIHVDELQYLHDIQSELAENWTGSVFDQEDPFKILNVSPTDSKQAVLAALMGLMRANPADMARLRQAQDRAFNPSVRFFAWTAELSRAPIIDRRAWRAERGWPGRSLRRTSSLRSKISDPN